MLARRNRHHLWRAPLARHARAGPVRVTILSRGARSPKPEARTGRIASRTGTAPLYSLARVLLGRHCRLREPKNRFRRGRFGFSLSLSLSLSLSRQLGPVPASAASGAEQIARTLRRNICLAGGSRGGPSRAAPEFEFELELEFGLRSESSRAEPLARVRARRRCK